MFKTSSFDGPKRVWLDELEILLDGQVVEGYEWKISERFRNTYPSSAYPSYLSFTDSERLDISLLADAANGFRRHFGLEEMALTEDRVHILHNSDFKYISPMSDYAIFLLGHIYFTSLLRSEVDLWLVGLSHELAHMAGFSSVRLHISQDVLHIDDLWDYGRFGLYRLNDKEEHEFYGLNEAMTEIIAARLRSRTACLSAEFRDRNHGIMSKTRAYAGFVSLIREVMSQMASSGRSRWNSRYDIEEALIRDYFAGTDEFLDELARLAPETWEYLRTLGVSKEENEDAEVMSAITLI